MRAGEAEVIGGLASTANVDPRLDVLEERLIQSPAQRGNGRLDDVESAL